jgi:arylsulfatase A-like enzyme/Tfp pilus assembly protein PilF
MAKRRRRPGSPPASSQQQPARGGASTSARSTPRRWPVAALVSASAILVALIAYYWMGKRGDAATGVPPVRNNILLITLDTTRADHLGAYGYARARTRHLDRLASEGVRFEWAFSPAPITLPAHASIFTGLYPFEHGVRNNGNFYLAGTIPTLATVLSDAGYRTGAFVSAFVLDRRYGLARGFETYDDRMETAESQVVALEAERRGDRTSLAFTAWLDRYAAGSLPQPPNGAATSSSGDKPPFFAWLHLYDPHEPYHPPQPFRGAFLDAPYDGEIAFDDAIVASVLDKLGQLGLLDNTLIAVVGDHGESLGDHGEETHSMFVYDAAIRVPLILWRPGRVPSGVVVSEPVRAIDLAPTLLELVGAPALKTGHARSLLPAISSPSAGNKAAAVYAETYLPQFYMNWAPLRMLRDDGWKYIDAPRPELYDLTKDPGETHNLANEAPSRASAMRDTLVRLTSGSDGNLKPGALDAETRRKLTALGYIGAAGDPAQPTGAIDRPDPKDMIAVFNKLRMANRAVRDRHFDVALPILRDVLRDNPKNAFAHLVLGSAHLGMDQYRPAIDEYRRYLELVPTSAYAHQWIAICHVRLHEQDDALKESAAALAIDPQFADSHVLRGGILASRGEYDVAISELRAAVATDPEKSMIRLDLAKVLAEAGRDDEAKREYETILAKEPVNAAALTGLGALRSKMGALEDAEAMLRRSLEVDPSQDGARFDLARVLEQRGRQAEARAEYQRVVQNAQASADVKASARQRLSALGSR